jgi:uncharacterized protein YlxW (UPF0749 family)
LSVTRTNYLVLAAVLFLLGALGMLAYRTNLAPPPVEGQTDRRAQLVEVVQELERDRDRLEERLKELRGTVEDMEKQSAARRGLYRNYTKELEELSMIAGLVSVEGPGLRIVLQDNPQPPDDGVDPNDYIIHDYDVRTLVNALWAGGAEAVAVNGQRVVHTTAIRCVGTTILVNNTRLGSPFVIEAVGDVPRLQQGLETDPEAELLLEQYSHAFGLRVKIDQHGELALPAYAGTLTPRELR